VQARAVILAITVISIAACATNPAGQTPATSSQPTAQPLPSPGPTVAEATASPLPTEATLVAHPSPTPSTLHAGGFARITVDALNVRTRPSVDAPLLVQQVSQDGGSGQNIIRVGERSKRTKVFLIEGPVLADGKRWWRMSPTVDADGDLGSAPSFVMGWIAQGGDGSPWIVPDDPCPSRPVEVGSLIQTTASWAIGLGCFGGEQLTVRGWYAGQPPGSGGYPCDSQPPFLCDTASIFPVQRGWGPGNENRFDFYFDRTRTLMPNGTGWVSVTGMFDALIAGTCPPDEDLGDLNCRWFFVASQVSVDEG
jgi:hypothetical protein